MGCESRVDDLGIEVDTSAPRRMRLVGGDSLVHRTTRLST